MTCRLNAVLEQTTVPALLCHHIRSLVCVILLQTHCELIQRAEERQ